MATRLKLFLYIPLAFISLVTSVVWPVPTYAQAIERWSPRQRIPGTFDKVETPYLVADSAGTVHAFYSQPVEDDPSLNTWAIFYSQWTVERGWTTPVDIILSPSGPQAHVMGAVLDQHGFMHVIFYGGEDTEKGIYYTKAPATKMQQGTAWSAPQLIGGAGLGRTAAIVGDGQNNLFVLYDGRQEGSGVYAISSTDGGEAWSDPMPIFLVADDRLLPYALQVRMDQQQQVHAVWSVNDLSGRGTAIEYARLEAGHTQWDEPMMLAVQEEGDYQAAWPAIGMNQQDLFVIYLKGSPVKRMMRRSRDGGQTWTKPVLAFPSEGEYGWADFAVDSAGALHVLFGDRAQGLDLWHSTWQGNSWRGPEPVVPLVGLEQYYHGGAAAFHPWWPHAVVSQGNILLVAWKQDPGLDGNGSWFSYIQLNTPAVAPKPIPTVLPSPTATSLPITPTVTATPTALVAGALITKQQGSSSATLTNPAGPLIFGIAPVILLVVGVIILHRLPQQRSQ